MSWKLMEEITLNTTELLPEQTMKEADPYVEQFGRFENEWAGEQPAWVLLLRKAGLARFAELGFPTLKHEDYRFTNMKAIAELPFHPAIHPGDDKVSQDTLATLPFASLPGHRLVFINGHFAPSLSEVKGLPQGVIVSSLRGALAKNSEVLPRYLGQHAGSEDSAFASLNDAFFADGAFIHVPAKQELTEPVQLLFLSTWGASGGVVHPRNLIVVGESSRVTVLEHYVSTEDGPYFNNAVTEIFAGDRAVVEHIKLQNESRQAFHVASIHADLGRESHVLSHSIANGAVLSRNNIRTTLNGEHLECVLNGLYLTRGEQLADHHMIVDHAKPHCASHEYFNGILADRSRGVFHGRILVRQEAQKTDAKQTNKNLLLSDDATATTKPQLEIYADDVKCTHGATVGQLNDESIFYLRARGIGIDTARRMLIHAFAGEIIERIQNEAIREEMDGLVWDILEEHEQVAVKF